MLFSCGEIHVFIDHRLQQALELLLYLTGVLSYVQWCSVLTKAKLGEVCIQVPGRE